MLSGSQSGSVSVSAGNTPGFYHFNVKASDGTLPRRQAPHFEQSSPALPQ
jgi:hypothetical protein